LGHFKELISNTFTPTYEGFWEGMNLVQMKYTGSFKAYVCDFNAQMSITSKVDELSKKCIFLGWVAKVGGRFLVQVSEAS
jgi:hypothetical protein